MVVDKRGRWVSANATLKVVLGILGAAIVVLLLFGAFGSGIDPMGGMERMMSGGMMGGGVIGVLLMLLFWGLTIALIVALIVWIVRQVKR